MGVSTITAIQNTELTFKVESSDTGLNQDLTYTFTWGDGEPSEVTTPATGSLVRTAAISHTYPHSGTYAATLSVSDSLGATSLLQTVKVTIQREPVIANAGPDQTVTEGTTVTFDASRTTSGDESILTYVWDFGDVSATEGAVDLVAPTHLYPDNGVYTVTVTVTDDIGLTSADTMIVTVNNVPPVVEVGVDKIADEGSLLSFSGNWTDAGVLDAQSYTWSFGDGASTTGTLIPTHNYADNGVYTVTLTVTDDDGGVGVDTLIVTVNNVPPTAEAGADQTADEGTAIAFSGSFTDPGALDTHTYLWAFGDSGTATGTLSPSHVYSDNGVYMVTLTVPDKDGGVGQDTLVVTVLDLAPRAGFTWAPEPQSEGSSVTFTDCSTSSPDSIAVWAWTIDGQIFAQRSPTYAFADNGEYIVSLKVTDDDGSTSTITHTVNVINVAPTADAGLDQTVYEGSPVVFAGNFTDPGADAHTIAWVFGDGATANGTLTPTHTYVDNGVYTVTLTVTDDDGGVGVDTLKVTVNNVVPTVEAGANLASDEGSPVTFSGSFTDPGADAHTIAWVFGDGATANGTLTPTHTYVDNGGYTVTLTVTDKDGGVGADTLKVTVLSIEVPTTSISLNGTQGEKGWYTSNVAVTLNAEGDTFKAIHYSVDGGAENVVTTNEVSFTISTQGIHTITYYSVSIANLTESVQTSTVNIDWTAPTIDITSPAQDEMFFPTSVIDLQYTVTDNVDANPTITVDPSSFPSPLPLGDLTITITATDAAGNTATKSITVKVQETTVKTPRQLKNDAKSLLLGSKTGIRDIDYAIDAAVALIDKSLNPQYWIDDSHLKDDHGIKVFIYEGKAAGGLQTSATLYDKSIPTLQKLIDQMARQHKDTTQQRARLAAMQKLIPIFKEAAAMLAEADEGLAKTALDEANALTPPKNGSSFATALKNAEKEYNDGLSDEAAGNPTKAIEDFKQSWIHSRQAAHIQ
jgi:PKD repeat protein